MANYPVNKIRNVCLMGHGGDGKTSLVESLLNISGATDRGGKIADGNTVCDFDPEEIRRKFSISTAVAPVEWNDYKINLLDTPGFFDFESEVQCAMRVAEVVQLYVADATGAPVPCGRVPQALRRFAKIDLQPGEEQVVTFTLTPRDLSHYDAALHDWYAAPGRYEIRIGHSSRDIRTTLPLHYAGTRLPPLQVDEPPPLGTLLVDPRTAPVVQHALREETAAMTNGGGDGLMPPEARIQMFDGLTLRNMINFGGPQAEERLNAMLAKLKEAVQ